jgi:hypothetical protein
MLSTYVLEKGNYKEELKRCSLDAAASQCKMFASKKLYHGQLNPGLPFCGYISVPKTRILVYFKWG